VTEDDLRNWIPSQPWFWPAQLIVFMTAVFERTSWRYPAARAYRNVLLEAGHLAQTFCLVSTELKLAPFTTHAIADSKVDAVLEIDGVMEGVIYLVGCGVQPRGGWSSDVPGLE
jgi:SagB-type dehydrogenase family enzyme